jgi:L-alanine-DL-glutamate epimerase-like enolase superfamily enzyme
MTGVGAAGPARRYGETGATAAAVLPELLDAVRAVGDPHALAAAERAMADVVHGNPAARAAVDVALHDLAAKRLGVPLYRLWGLDAAAPPTSFTIGLDDPESTAERAAEAVDAGRDVLKLKLGTDDATDRARVEAVREAVPDATIRVDANEAWSPRQAIANDDWLVAADVELLEQPTPADDPAGLRRVYERVRTPLAVDESVTGPADVPAVADRTDVVVVKVSKCAGLRRTRRTIHAARAHGLEVMLGCMVESNAAIAAGWQVAPLADYVDLDGALLLADGADPFAGVPLDGNEARLSAVDRAGTGARENGDRDGVTTGDDRAA